MKIGRPCWVLLWLVVAAPASAQSSFGEPVRPEALRAWEAGEREAGEGESEDEIVTDRDSFTPATSTVAPGRFILESAYTFVDNRRTAETHSLPEFLGRYGATDWLELRIGANYEIGGAGNPTSGNVPDDLLEGGDLEEETNLLYGAKLALTGQSGLRPESALTLQGHTPTAGVETASRFSATYVAGWTFANDWVWDSAVHYATGKVEEDDFNTFSPSTVLKVPVGRRWKAHLEYFSVVTDGLEIDSARHFISPGAHYLITPDFELGVRFGWGLNDDAPRFFTNFGGGVRF